MDSMPPARTVRADPDLSRSCPSITAFIPEPHTLFTVVVVTVCGKPLPSTACRAGAWPIPAGNTQPSNASSTSPPSIAASSRHARIAAAPSSGADAGASAPWKAPMGVRRAEIITMDSVLTGVPCMALTALHLQSYTRGAQLCGCRRWCRNCVIAGRHTSPDWLA